MRQRLAPMALRMASSCWRAVPRASRRMETLTASEREGPNPLRGSHRSSTGDSSASEMPRKCRGDRGRLESNHHRRGSPRGRPVLTALRKCRRPFRSPRHARTHDYPVRCAGRAGPGAGGRAQLSVLAAAFQFRSEGGRALPSTGSQELHDRGRRFKNSPILHFSAALEACSNTVLRRSAK